METWVDRIAQSQLGFQLELKKFRKKYETEEQPPEEFPRGFQESNWRKFESLFPEFREWEKTQKAEVSPAMASEPYTPLLWGERNPFREAPIIAPPAEPAPPIEPPTPPTETRYPEPFMHLPPTAEEPDITPALDFSKLWGYLAKAPEFLLTGMEDTFTSIGALLTAPWRAKELGELARDEPVVSFLAGGRGFEQYKKWKGHSISIPLPSWKQLGASLKPILETDITLRALGIDVSKWEEPERYEWATLGMKETSEFLPFILLGGGAGKKPLEEGLKMAVKQIGKGKPPEEAMNVAFNWLAKKGKMPKFAIKPEVPAVEPAIKPPAIEPKAPIKPPAPKALKPVPETVPEAIEPMQAVSVKLADIVGKAKPARKELEAIKSAELTRKIPAYAGLLNKAKTFTEAAMARGTLKGKLIPDAGDIIPIGEQFTPQEIALMIQKVNISEAFVARPLTRGNIIDSLQRLLMEGKLPTEMELEWLGKIFPELVEAIAKRAPLSKKLWNAFLEIANLPRAVLASGDASASLRQMIILAPRYPISAARATLTGLRAGLSTLWYRDYAITVDKAIHASKFAAIREEARLYLAPLTGTLRMAKREEAYMSSVLSRLARDWPQYGLLKKIATAPFLPIGKWTQVSEAIFITTLNKIRADIFDRYALLWGKKASMAELRALAEVINIGTGRGTLPGNLERMVPALNTVLFSLRLQLARMQALAWPVTLWKYPPRVRRMVVGNIVAMIGTISGILGMLELGKIGTVEKDRRSADFGKLRVGNTRLDPWGGFQQWVVLINRLLSGELKTADKRIVDIDREDTLIRFLGMKLSPAVGFMRDVFRGETFLGEELTLETEDVQKQAYERLVPMFTRDVIDAIREDGWVGGLTASPGFLGVGVVSYPSRTFADWLTYIEEKTGKEWTTEEMLAVRPDFNKAEEGWLEYFELPTGRMREEYRMTHPEIEANLYFWGEVKQLLNAKEAEPFLQTLLDKHKLSGDLLPIREVFEVYDPSDKTEDEIFGDFVNLLPKWWADYVFQFEAEWRRAYLPGYIDSIKQLKGADSILIKQYYAETRGTDAKFKLEYRRMRPDTDAALIFWKGFASLQSTQAHNSLAIRMRGYGLPMELFPKSVKPSPRGLIWEEGRNPFRK